VSVQAIAQAARGLFDLPVAVGVTRPIDVQPDLLPGEAAVIAQAVPGRRAEFRAGRAAARQAMVALGGAPQAVLAAPDRAPIWPAGLVGSISHNADYCIAVLALAQDAAALGIDIEDDSPLPRDLVHEVCVANERARIAGPDAAHLAKRIFCAKEATYKAQYPLTGLLFGFDQIEVTLGGDAGSFTARFVKPTGRFAVGDCLPGRIAQVAGHLVTGVAIGQITAKGA
tara:strand:+ start:33244 stop:33924 length:681 start_codon:yes stop_codon:yes gene_type:complete